MAEDAQGLEVIGLSTILELDADEVPVFRRGTGTDFNGKGRSVIGQTLKLGEVLHNLGHVEERDEGLVGSLNEQELKGVPVEGNALQSSENRVHGGAAGHCEGLNQ